MTTIANPPVKKQQAQRVRHARERREQVRDRARWFLSPRNAEEVNG